MKAKKLSKRILASIVSVMMVLGCFVLPTAIVNAASETKVNIHYLREDGKYDKWNVWAWADGLDGASYEFSSTADSNGVVTTVTITEATPKLGFIIRKGNWEAKDPDGDRYVDLSSVVAGTVDVYCISGQGLDDFTVDYSKTEQGLKLKTAEATSKTNIDISFTVAPEASDNVKVSDFSVVSAGGDNVALSGLTMNGAAGKLTTADQLDYFKEYTITFRDVAMKLTMPDYFSSEEFESQYTYDGNDLGVTFANGSTNFRVWAPTAKKMELNIYAAGNGGKAEQVIEMTKAEKGTWTVVANGNMSGKYYTYTAYLDGKTNKDIVDPYARTVGVNGKRGMILDLDSTDPAGWSQDSRHTYKNLTDMQIYEVHVRDFSIDSPFNYDNGIENKGKYLAFTERGTKTPSGVKTGVDHLVDLGITSVHILPSYDYGSVDETKLDKAQFNWGYDPVNYNAPEGSYSTDPYKGEVRVNEYKQMVKGLHDAGLGVIMDVVYNHTYNTNYCFNQLVPGYFYRPGQNTSGCGNDVASERSMVRKFIVESVKYWAEEYHLDGFRFDLMGILDVDTMNAVRAALDEIDPTIVIYGEGWNMNCKPTKSGTLMANYTNAALTPGIAYFSDNLRDTIKGSVFDAADKGYANGNVKNWKTVVPNIQYTKIWCPEPSQIVNYADCHDNYTLWDKIRSSNGDDSEADQIRQNLLAAVMYQTSEGIPFMMSGEEFLRTKTKEDGTFEHNSYASPDSVNALDYSRCETYADVYNYYKGLIAFRKAHSALRISTAEESAAMFKNRTGSMRNGVTAFTADSSSESVLVIFNPLSEDYTYTLPEGNWTIYVNDKKAGTEALGTASDTVTVPRISAMVLVSEKVQVEKLRFDKTELTLNKGETATLKLTITPEDASGDAINWISTNEKVVTVDNNGTITAVGGGTAKVKAIASNGKAVACKVTVPYVAVTSVNLQVTNAEVYVGDEINVSDDMSILPENATDKSVTWTSSNTSIATVDQNGKVKCVGVGTATITAKSVDGAEGVCTVKVRGIPVISVTLDQANYTVEEGGSFKLNATILPEDATKKTLTWTTSNEKVAKVDQNGKVTAVAAGTATIKAKSSNSKVGKCVVTVAKKNIAVESVKLNKTSVAIGKGETITLTAAVAPSNATNKTVTWTSSDTKVATVSGGKVTGVGTGTVIITAKSGGKTANCTVSVRNAPTKITLTKGILTIGVGEKYQVGSGVNDGAAAATRTYRTSNSAVVKMTRTDWVGEFVGVKPGVAYVTVRTYNGKESSCKVTVKEAPASVKLNKGVMTLKVGQTGSLSAIVPDGSGCATRTFRTSNSSVVKMTKTNWTGEFKAMKVGTAYVTVRTYNGKEASCKVTVVK